MTRRRDWKAVTQDYTALQDYDDVDAINLCLTQRQVAILKAALVPQYWTTRWTNLTVSSDELNEEMSALDAALDEVCTLADPQLEVRTNPADTCSLQQSPDGGIQWFEFADVENCIVVSPTIINITNNVTNNTTNITNNTNNVTLNTFDIDLINNGDISINVYPPPPTQVTPDRLCGASWYISEQLDDLIQQTIIDEPLMSLADWLLKVLAESGIFGAAAKILFDFIEDSVNPNLSTEVTDAIPEVAEAVFCATLDRTVMITNINANLIMTADAKTAYIDAIDSVTDGTLALWAFIGEQDLTRDCSLFSCVCAANIRFFPGDPNVTIVEGSDQGTHWEGGPFVNNTTSVELGLAWANCSIARVEVQLRAVFVSGPDPAPRNIGHFLNGGLLSTPPFDTSSGQTIISGEDITPFSGGYLEWMVRIGFNPGNVWRLEIDWMELILE